MRICTNCEKEIITKDFENNYCENCEDKLCKKCKRTLHICLSCQTTHCEKCDYGFSQYAWDDIDIFKCIDCREITIEELYKYIVDTYNEKLNLKEISNIIKNKLKNI